MSPYEVASYSLRFRKCISPSSSSIIRIYGEGGREGGRGSVCLPMKWPRSIIFFANVSRRLRRPSLRSEGGREGGKEGGEER